MKTAFKSALAMAAATVAMAGTVMAPISASATGTFDGRTTYSLKEINVDRLLDKNGNKITFNSIVYNADTDSKWHKDGMVENETNFVGARKDDGDKGAKNVWNGTSIVAEDNETYVVRLYVHNNNPNGTNATAEGVKVRFYVPYASGTEVKVNGWLTAANATPNEYLDNVIFKSKDGTPFHLEYVTGSAKLENNGFADKEAGGYKLADSLVNQGNTTGNIEDTWTTIGYNGLNGQIPGCYEYINYVTIKVKAVYDDFTVQKQVRLAGDTDKTWKDSVEAKVGDKVEFMITYRNISQEEQTNVVIRDVLPSNLRYVKGSTQIKNSTYPSGTTLLEDYLVEDGIRIGSYGPNAKAYIMFTAEVVDDNLACGGNTLVNWGRATVDGVLLQDSASVHLEKYCEVVTKLPTAGPEMMLGGAIATGAVATAAGYYIVSRRQLRK